MAERRSNRAKSNINYSKYDVGDDDDDFADPTPPTRKLKKDKENFNKSVAQKEKLLTTDKKSKSRKPPPEDRLLELQIKEALAASLKEGSGDNNNSQTVDKDDDDSCFLVNNKPTSIQKHPGNDCKIKNNDEIEVISSTTVSDSPPRKRQKTTHRYNCIDSDSDNDKDSTYAGESEDSDDDEFDPDDDEDEIQSKKKTNAVKTVTKVSKTPEVKSTVKTPTLTKCGNKLKPRLPSTPIINTAVLSSPAGTITPKSTPALSRTPGSLTRKIPSWTPPGPAGKNTGESIKSPGGIRIGLSRQQRVKTLHPSLTVQP